MTISIVISTHNRSSSLYRTLSSVKSFADEIIVVDSGSTDDTVKVAKSFTKKVFSRPNNLMLNINKNFGFSKASGDWILCLDDDEDITADLVKEIRMTLKSAHADVQGYWIPRKNIIFGRWIQHGLWWPDRQLRLFRNGYGKFPEKHVHEYILVVGRTEALATPYVHHNYDSIGQYLGKMQEIYTESEIQKYEAANYRVNWQDAIRFPASDFFKIYFAQEGYKDGLHGLVLAILQSFYSFIIFAKLWERAKFREEDIRLTEVVNELQKSGKEFSYWAETSYMKETKNPFMKLWHKIRRRYGRQI